MFGNTATNAPKKGKRGKRISARNGSFSFSGTDNKDGANKGGGNMFGGFS